MTVLLAFLAVHRTDADIFTRYAEFRKSHPVFSVDLTGSLFGTQYMAGSVSFDFPNRYLYKAKWDHFDPKEQRRVNYDYTLSLTEKGYYEIEKSTKTYEELPYPGFMAVFTSDINGAANGLFPKCLIPTDLRKLMPKGATPTITTNGNIVSSYLTSKGPMGGKAEQWADFDSEARLIRFREKIQGGMVKPSDVNWTFTNYRFPSRVSVSDYTVTIPLGFVPYSLPRLSYNLQIGASAPVSGWTSPSGQANVDLSALANHKPFVIAVLGSNSPPSTNSRRSISKIGAHIPVFIVGPGGYKDPSGKLLKALSPPATPLFFLIDSKGKVAKAWMGYDPSQAAAFETEVLKFAANPALPPQG